MAPPDLDTTFIVLLTKRTRVLTRVAASSAVWYTLQYGDAGRYNRLA